MPAFWSSNGSELFFYEDSDTNLWAISATGNREARRVLTNISGGADLSPDGRWLASASAETGTSEVYISKIGSSAKRRVSIDGGVTPLWRKDGRELFYVKPQGASMHMMAMPITTSPGFSTAAATELFAGPYRAVWPGRAFDASADGRRFLMTEEPDEPPVDIKQMIVAQNWWTGGNQRPPAKPH